MPNRASKGKNTPSTMEKMKCEDFLWNDSVF